MGVRHKTLAELSTEFELHPTQIVEWKRQLLEGAAEVFGGGASQAAAPVDLSPLHAKIGQLALENDFFGLDLASLVKHPSLARTERRTAWTPKTTD